jgi:hypothetical protein
MSLVHRLNVYNIHRTLRDLEDFEEFLLNLETQLINIFFHAFTPRGMSVLVKHRGISSTSCFARTALFVSSTIFSLYRLLRATLVIASLLRPFATSVSYRSII